MFELNGSYSDVQKTKTKTANRSRFWLPKVGTLDETIEERCRAGGAGEAVQGSNKQKCDTRGVTTDLLDV